MTTILPAGSVAAILPAAGKSTRFGGEEKKIFATLGGKPVWYHAAERMRRCPEVARIIIAIDTDDRPRWETEFAEMLQELDATIVDGGRQRYDSVRNAIARAGSVAHVAIHDAARPLVPEADLRALFQAAADSPAVMLATPLSGTVKRADTDRHVLTTVDRSGLWEALTPQLFRRESIEHAYDRWRGWPITDDASLVERAGGNVLLVPGSRLNLKITEAQDLMLAEAILRQTH